MKWKLLKALYKLRKEMGDHFRDDVQLTIKIFDTVITPILCSVLEIDIIFLEKVVMFGDHSLKFDIHQFSESLPLYIGLKKRLTSPV